MAEQEKPRLRKPLGVLLLIIFLALYAAFVAVAAEPVLRLPALAQAPAWLLLGIAWVPLALPLVRWIETGRFRR
jgi:hypothetical protein